MPGKHRKRAAPSTGYGCGIELPDGRQTTRSKPVYWNHSAMKTVFRVALVATLFVSSCLAQKGTVTFYTPGNSVKSTTASLLPRSQQPFTGWLFDGPQPLAHVQPGRFMTFHLSPGEHSFTVPWHSTRPGKDQLSIKVESGGQYCVRLSAKMTNFEPIPYERLNSQVEEVPCQQAQSEAAHMKPIEIKRVDPAARGELDPTTTFPSDSQSQH